MHRTTRRLAAVGHKLCGLSEGATCASCADLLASNGMEDFALCAAGPSAPIRTDGPQARRRARRLRRGVRAQSHAQRLRLSLRRAAAAVALAAALLSPAVAWAPVPCIAATPALARLASPAPAGERIAPSVPALAPLAPWLPAFARYSAEYGVPSSLLEAMALVESSGDPAAVSSAGAVGLLQVRAATWGPVCQCDLRQADASILWGARVLAGYAARAGASPACLAAGPGGSPDCAWRTNEALSSYAAGPWGGYQAGYVARVRARWLEIADEEGAAAA